MIIKPGLFLKNVNHEISRSYSSLGSIKDMIGKYNGFVENIIGSQNDYDFESRLEHLYELYTGVGMFIDNLYPGALKNTLRVIINNVRNEVLGCSIYEDKRSDENLYKIVKLASLTYDYIDCQRSIYNDNWIKPELSRELSKLSDKLIQIDSSQTMFDSIIHPDFPYDLWKLLDEAEFPKIPKSYFDKFDRDYVDNHIIRYNSIWTDNVIDEGGGEMKQFHSSKHLLSIIMIRYNDIDKRKILHVNGDLFFNIPDPDAGRYK